MRTAGANIVVLLGLLCQVIPTASYGRGPLPDSPTKEYYQVQAQLAPAYQLAAHRVGRMVLGITNSGTFGTGFSRGGLADVFTGDEVKSCEYPKKSKQKYLYAGAFWIGAVVGRDTLVSTGAGGDEWAREFHPDASPFGDIVHRSIIDPEAPEYKGAVSEEDYVSVYTDTLSAGVRNDYSGRRHIPLNIEVTEASFAWSYSYAEDLVLFDYSVKNIGGRTLEDVYMGIYVDADIGFEGKQIIYEDDLAGFVHTLPAQCGRCEYTDTVFLAWTADNDGDLREAPPTGAPVPHVTATRIVRTPSRALEVSFNWWIRDSRPDYNFGPREQPFKGKWNEAFRDFGTGALGSPLGDANKYYVMRNREFDYDQAYTASIRPTDSLWLLPPQNQARIWARALDTRYILSFGPFNINPGERLPISFAYFAGEDFHSVYGNLENLPDHPDAYYENIDFSDLGRNARWASWIYDNPGVDTDGDGYFGEYFLCPLDSLDSSVVDTCWIRGDGIPDFKGASPPPAPEFWIEPGVGRLTMRFNGFHSETTRDVFSRQIDFEGYRIYLGRDDRVASYSLVASYDIEDYNKWVYNSLRDDWELLEEPYPLEELRCLYADSCSDLTFDPLEYTRAHPYVHPYADSLFFFDEQDRNASVFGITTPIRKRFPSQPYPSSLDPDSVRPEELTEDGYLKYFEYEFDITDLLATVSYWVNVTAFDYGSPQSGLPSLETSVSVGAKEACPLERWQEVRANDRKVYVWPNPYRFDAKYRAAGFEGRTDTDRPDDRVRAVHFANLPPKCIIRIYSLDGDLVREIVHDKDCEGSCATTNQWNLISRNTQLVVSGLYYWTVEDERGSVQIGKLMIIM